MLVSGFLKHLGTSEQGFYRDESHLGPPYHYLRDLNE